MKVDVHMRFPSLGKASITVPKTVFSKLVLDQFTKNRFRNSRHKYVMMQEEASSGQNLNKFV